MKKTLKIKNKKLMVMIFVLVLGIMCYEYFQSQLPLNSSSGVQLQKCVDGDTAHLVIDGKEETVRFLAIDTPETVKPGTPVQPYGKEASEMTCGLLTEAKEIKLEYEESNKTDKYGRLLAWVWVDGELLQQKLISEGYAEVKYIYGDYKYTDQLIGIQEHAKVQKKGVWTD